MKCKRVFKAAVIGGAARVNTTGVGEAETIEEIPDLIGYYKADTDVYEATDDAAENGDAVTEWLDQSLEGNDLKQGNASYQPTLHTTAMNNLPALNYTANNRILYRDAGDSSDFDFDGDTQFSAFAAVRMDFSATYQIIMSHRTTTQGWDMSVYGGEFGMVIGKEIGGANQFLHQTGADDTASDDTNYYCVCRYDGSADASGVEIWVNGNKQTSFTTVQDTLSGNSSWTLSTEFEISGNDNAYNEWLGYIAEAGVIARKITDEEVDLINGSLAKYIP